MRSRVASTLAGFAVIVAAGCATHVGTDSNEAPPRTTAELKAFVLEAARLVESEGENAFAKFDAEGGRFRRGDEYVFVLDTRGNCVYHGFEAERVGTNVSALTDEDGRPYGKRLAEIAGGKAATGWSFYKKTRPETGGEHGEQEEQEEQEEQWKATRLVHAKAPSGAVYTVGSGVYGFEPDREFLVDLVEDAAGDLGRGGRATLSAIDAAKGPYVYRDVAVFVMEMDGVLLANALFPELISKNIFDYRGPDGKSPADEHIRVAKTRGYGFCEYTWHHPDGAPGRKLAYVRRVSFEGRPVVVGASLYLDSRGDTGEDARPAPPEGSSR